MPRFAVFAFALLWSFAPPAFGRDTPVATAGAAMGEAAAQWLTALDDDQRAAATLPFDDRRRLDWHNIPKPRRKGVPLSDMTQEQRHHCHELLRTALSERGYRQAVDILALENNLREGEKHLVGGHVRDPLLYYLTIFGEPADTGTWGWSFEGHHLSLNFVIHDGHVVSDSPSFWGANPATVHEYVDGGPEVGVRTLADEEQRAFELLASLDDGQRRRARIADVAPNDYRGPGAPEPPDAPPAGLPAADMTEDQRQLLRELLVAYAGHLARELSEARLAEIDAHGWDSVHFAWLGAERPGVGHGYRVQGPTFLLELVNVQSDPAGNPANHIHSVWRSLQNDFGAALQ
ncbi:MAG TPA: DUF3500 domain-containing protein [Lacipirellulaceae bacterium]|nr:DUF3500 domain-containing protein [Lacipirellulaceae bacterium]